MYEVLTVYESIFFFFYEVIQDNKVIFLKKWDICTYLDFKTNGSKPVLLNIDQHDCCDSINARKKNQMNFVKT